MNRSARPDVRVHAAAASGHRTPAGKLELSTETLFATQREVLIRHAGEEYRLRLTRLNRLILTK